MKVSEKESDEGIVVSEEEKRKTLAAKGDRQEEGE